MRNRARNGGVHFAGKLYYVANTLRLGHNLTMLNILSILFGIIAGLIAFIGIFPIPLLPLVNWIALPIAIVGAALGAMSSSNGGRNLNLIIILISGLRLFLTGGII